MAYDDLFGDEHYDFLAPAGFAAVVTPNDSTDLPFATRAVWVGGAGTLTVNMKGQNAQNPGQANVLISGIPAGTLLPIAVTRIKTTGTTATLIVALW